MFFSWEEYSADCGRIKASVPQCPGRAGSAGGKKPGESASTAPSGSLVCIQAFGYFINERYYHILCAGCRYSSTGLDFSRWSVPAENPGNICRPRCPPRRGFF